MPLMKIFSILKLTESDIKQHEDFTDIYKTSLSYIKSC
jgi:hypothetical protein